LIRDQKVNIIVEFLFQIYCYVTTTFEENEIANRSLVPLQV